MARCKYVGQVDDQWLSTGEQCDQEVRLTTDRSVKSKRVRLDSSYVTHPYTWVFPTIVCPSGLCNYHFNKKYFKKLGPGRQS